MPRGWDQAGWRQSQPTVGEPSTTHQQPPSPPFSLPSEVTQTHVPVLQARPDPVQGLAPDRCKPPRPWKRPGRWRLCMIKVTSKIGSHKRAQSFAIVRPDSVGCPTRMRSVCPLRAPWACPGSPWLEPASPPPANIRYARPRVGWFWAVWSRGWRRRELVLLEVGGCGHASRVVLLLPLQRLWALTGVWCVSTDVIPRCQ